VNRYSLHLFTVHGEFFGGLLANQLFAGGQASESGARSRLHGRWQSPGTAGRHCTLFGLDRKTDSPHLTTVRIAHPSPRLAPGRWASSRLRQPECLTDVRRSTQPSTLQPQHSLTRTSSTVTVDSFTDTACPPDQFGTQGHHKHDSPVQVCCARHTPNTVLPYLVNRTPLPKSPQSTPQPNRHHAQSQAGSKRTAKPTTLPVSQRAPQTAFRLQYSNHSYVLWQYFRNNHPALAACIQYFWEFSQHRST
jgi:hypothetical protein